MPTFANFTKGSATIDAKYQKLGKLVNFRLNITLSSSTMGSGPTFTFPLTAVSHTTNYPIGFGQILDSGTGTYIGVAQYATTTTAQIRYFDAAATSNGIGVATPFAWANNDQISINGTYEAA